uniref:Uncharacterized protein n=1 Tax=Lepeophtheirus salmonis TaxID=72036 RepID=A0A0K2SVN4_LEPSM
MCCKIGILTRSRRGTIKIARRNTLKTFSISQQSYSYRKWTMGNYFRVVTRKKDGRY